MYQHVITGILQEVGDETKVFHIEEFKSEE